MELKYFASDYQPVLIQTFVALMFVILTLSVTNILLKTGKRVRTLKKEENFECGIEIQGNARFPFSVKYFLVAILFVLFDVEVIFFYPWAVNFVNANWNDFLNMLLFMGIFVVGFFYIYKKGALDWNKEEE
ncbi:MAG: NADH-quinone oxidoreductase subunit A [Paludibacter sp.]|nr:NADH-quinone oxidoreductase subunit A [Paludibacter sp.]